LHQHSSIRPATVRVLDIGKKGPESKVIISGIGISHYENCVFSGNEACGYISVNGTQYPCDLNLIGTGVQGSYVSVPECYLGILRKLQNS
jgi:hypothetical protein